MSPDSRQERNKVGTVYCGIHDNSFSFRVSLPQDLILTLNLHMLGAGEMVDMLRALTGIPMDSCLSLST